MVAAPVAAYALDDALDPTGSGRALPAEAYTSEEVLAWERRHFFAGGWVCAGRAGEVGPPGARRAVAVGDDAILLVRDREGLLHAYFNVCRHRGSALVHLGSTETGGAIRCPYHGWTYALDGSLRATPRFAAPADFDPGEHGLVPVRMEEWHGWVMVNVSGDAPPLSEWVGALGSLVAPYQCDDLVVAASHEYVVAANWKLPVENFHECYHCPAIHPELCAVSPPSSGSNYDLPGAWFGGTMDLAAHADTMSLSGATSTAFLPGLDESRRRQVLYVGVFPNLLLSLHPDYVLTHRIEPRGPDESVIECQWLFAPETVARADFDPSYAIDFWDITNRQDWNACEGVQRGVTSRGYRPGPLSVAEHAVRQFIGFVAQSYRDGAMPVR
jgi:glycine betaine catabolism A